MTVTRAALPEVLRAAPRIGDWLAFPAEGPIQVLTGKVEYGQGIRTSIGQLVAEELGVAFGDVDVVPVDTDRSPDEGVTSGSRSIEESNEAIRRVAATARDTLLRTAARRLEVDVAALRIRDGRIEHPDGITVTFAQLADSAVLDTRCDGAAPLTPPEAWRLIGRSIARVDLPAKVAGRPAFVQDLDLPGMVHARVVRPPTPDARLVELDAAELSALPGVIAVVRDGSFVAVVAEREEQAIRAQRRARRAARWTPTTPRPLDPSFLRTSPSRDVVVHAVGDPAPIGPGARRLEASYSRPYLAHAALGPSCAVARMVDGRLEVWAHAQGPHHLRQELAKVLRTPEAAIRVVHAEGAGCYGANGADDVALDAALIARALPGTPIRVQWMREDEFRWEPLGTAMTATVSAVLDEHGDVLAWTHDVWGNGHRDRPGPDAPSDASSLIAANHLAEPMTPMPAPAPSGPGGGGGRNAAPPYDFPVQRIVNHFVPHTPIRVSALRSLGAHLNVFAAESFVDELAHAIGEDPLAWRLRRLRDARGRAVLDAVADAAGGWAPERVPPDVGRGIGYARYKGAGAAVAVIAEVELADDLRLRRIWAAVDAGLTVNPDGLRNQAEGGILQAAGWTMREIMRSRPDGSRPETWADYPTLATSELPEVEVVLLDRPDQPPAGVGEAFAGPTAAAIGNALFAATGVRVRDLPFDRARLEAALA